MPVQMSMNHDSGVCRRETGPALLEEEWRRDGGRGSGLPFSGGVAGRKGDGLEQIMQVFDGHIGLF